MYNCPNIKPIYKLTKTIFIYNRLFRHDINKQKTFKRIQTEVDQEKKIIFSKSRERNPLISK